MKITIRIILFTSIQREIHVLPIIPSFPIRGGKALKGQPKKIHYQREGRTRFSIIRMLGRAREGITVIDAIIKRHSFDENVRTFLYLQF